ncbi:MAG TPA: hypothetical protein VNN17_04725 [Terriglobia bacterium]|nr:hypothetical protein [Terriglobia bacterium]
MNLSSGDRSEVCLAARRRIGRIGVELLLKAALCAAMMAMIAGVAAAFLG